MGAVVALAVVFLLFVVIALVTIRRLVVISAPNEVLVLSGVPRRVGDRQVGYRVARGRVLRIPILEQVSRMDLSAMSVSVAVQNAYSAEGIPVRVDGVAHVKVSADPHLIGNAIERFLQRPREEIARVARETLEGHLRMAVAKASPDGTASGDADLADEVVSLALEDLAKLGLALDGLKLQTSTPELGDRGPRPSRPEGDTSARKQRGRAADLAAESLEIGVELSFPAMADAPSRQLGPSFETSAGTIALSFDSGFSERSDRVEPSAVTELPGELFAEPVVWKRWSQRTSDLRDRLHLEAEARVASLGNRHVRVRISAGDERQLTALKGIAETLRPLKAE